MTGGGRVAVCGEAVGAPLDIVDGEGEARAVVWPGMGARMRAMHRVRLAPGAATTELTHPVEAVYAVLAGGGRAVDADEGVEHAVELGSMVHLDGGTAHRFVAGDAGLDLVGGPAPADPAVYGEAT